MKAHQVILKLMLCTLLAACNLSNNNNKNMKETDSSTDKIALSKLNEQFIKNYITGDVKAHNEIIHKDFVCIENNGSIIGREEYLKNWATDYKNSRVDSFTYTDEFIRVFGNTALVRSASVYTKMKDGQPVKGYSVYTDTYIKENGRWYCVQAQMTPVQ